LSLCSAINIFDLKFAFSGDRFSAVITFVVAVVNSFLPLAFLVFIWRMRNRLEEKELIARFGSLYDGLKKNRVIHLLC